MKNATAKKLLLCLVCISTALLASMAYSHCQIPCGIYNDQMRFDMIAENITTIEKSMNMITKLSGQPKPLTNQIVRWVQNKEEHADDTSDIITCYFMAQRLKPADKTDPDAYNEYVKKLTQLHEMLIESMKAKQTTDLSHVEKLRSLLAEFKSVYLGESACKHGDDHNEK